MAIASASLVVTVWFGKLSISLSKNTLEQAREVAARASTDWQQQQWFALFIAADEAFNLLDRFQAVINTNTQERLGALTLQIRRVQTLAMVFPKCQEVDVLCEALKFPSFEFYQSEDKLAELGSALEALRQRALVRPTVIASNLH